MSFALTEINDLDIIEYDDMISEECNNYCGNRRDCYSEEFYIGAHTNILMIIIYYIYISSKFDTQIFIPHECN